MPATEYTYRDRMLLVTRGHPLPRGRRPRPAGSTSSCSAGTARRSRWSSPSPATPRSTTEIPLDPRVQPDRRPLARPVDGLPEEFCYGYRVDGPEGPVHRYDPSIVLLDPAARALSCGRPWGPSGGPAPPEPGEPDDGRATRDDLNPRIPREDTILYELHVRGFTVDPSLGRPPPRHLRRPGREDPLPQGPGGHGRRAAADRRVRRERLPVRQPADRREAPELLGLQHDRLRGAQGGLRQQPGAVGAPGRSSAGWSSAFHEAGIEVILDVVFNHTAEGGEDGPTYNFRGLDNSLYYMLDDQGRYLNFTRLRQHGQQQPPGRPQPDPLAACGTWWPRRDVDGFRFDLASVLGRDRRGNVLVEPPVIETDLRGLRCCADTKLIAEPWDAAGLYQVGSFPGGPALVGLERPVPRRRPPVLAGRARDDLGPGHPALRQRRPLPRPRAAPLDQLHHLPRRLHPGRPRLLQREAQRGQRRGEPRRQRRQLQLELRRRGADRRPDGPRAPRRGRRAT